MEIQSWLCLPLPQLLKLPSMPGLGSSTAENPLDLLPVIRQGLPGAPSCSEVSLRAEPLP